VKEGVGVWGMDIDRKTGRQTGSQSKRQTDWEKERLWGCGAAMTDDRKMTDSTFRSGCSVSNELQRFNVFDVQKNETTREATMLLSQKFSAFSCISFFFH